MQQALRPYATAGVALVGAGLIAMTPMAPRLPDPFTATRYHSLAVVESTLPTCLEVTARTDSGVVMALRHHDVDVEGVQFHPESVLTQGGHQMLANWLVRCGDADAPARAGLLSSPL